MKKTLVIVTSIKQTQKLKNDTTQFTRKTTTKQIYRVLTSKSRINLHKKKNAFETVQALNLFKILGYVFVPCDFELETDIQITVAHI